MLTRSCSTSPRLTSCGANNACQTIWWGLLKGGSRRDDRGLFKGFLFGEKLHVQGGSIEIHGHLSFLNKGILVSIGRAQTVNFYSGHPRPATVARLLGCSVAASKRRCTTEPPKTSIVRTCLMLCSFYLPSSRLDPVHLIALAFFAPLTVIISRVWCLRNLFGVTTECLLEIWVASQTMCLLPSPLPSS